MWQGTFSPGWSHQPGLKVYLYFRLVALTGSKALVPASGVARDWKVTFSPGWIHQPGLKVPPYKSCWPSSSSPSLSESFSSNLSSVLALSPSILRFLHRFLRFLRRFFGSKGYQFHTLMFHRCLISFCSLYIYIWFFIVVFFSFVSNLSSKSLQACILHERRLK